MKVPDTPADWDDIHLDADGNPRIVERRFVVEDVYAGYRLDHFLKCKIPRLSRTKLQTIIRTQVLPVRGRVLKPHSAVTPGDEIILRRPARPEPSCPRDFAVLYDDPHMMVIDKPAGLPVHASAKFYFNTLTRVLSERYPGQGLQICHRLDRETSGVLVVARGKPAARALKGAFARHRVRKVYLAVVHGQPPWPGPDDAQTLHPAETLERPATDRIDGNKPVAVDDTVTCALAAALDLVPGDRGPGGEQSARNLLAYHRIDLPLGMVEQTGQEIAVRMVVRADAQPAETRVRVLARRDHCTLVLCIPVTGRQHQIRAHLAACGYPIVGDKLYGHGDEAFAEYCAQGLTAELLARFELPRQALHAAAIAIPSPERPDEFIRVTSRLPADLQQYLDRPRDDSHPITAPSSPSRP